MGQELPHNELQEFQKKLKELREALAGNPQIKSFENQISEELRIYNDLLHKYYISSEDLSPSEVLIILPLTNYIIFLATSFVLADVLASTENLFKKYSQAQIQKVCPQYFQNVVHEGELLNGIKRNFNVKFLKTEDINEFYLRVIRLVKSKNDVLRYIGDLDNLMQIENETIVSRIREEKFGKSGVVVGIIAVLILIVTISSVITFSDEMQDAFSVEHVVVTLSDTKLVKLRQDSIGQVIDAEIQESSKAVVQEIRVPCNCDALKDSSEAYNSGNEGNTILQEYLKLLLTRYEITKIKEKVLVMKAFCPDITSIICEGKLPGNRSDNVHLILYNNAALSKLTIANRAGELVRKYLILRELGHHVLGHLKAGSSLVSLRKPYLKEIISLKLSNRYDTSELIAQELAADNYAVWALSKFEDGFSVEALVSGFDNEVIKLLDQVELGRRNRNAPGHPLFSERVDLMRRFEEALKIRKNGAAASGN